MYELFYRTEVNVICLLMLGWITYQSRVNQDQQTKHILFRKVMISSAVVLFLETIQFHIDGRPGTVLYVLNNILSLAYLSMNAVMAYNWFVYTMDFSIGKEKVKSVFRHIVFIPVILFVMLLVLSLFTGFIFFIEPETNRLTKGTWYFMQAIVTYGFFTSAAFIAFITVLTHRYMPSRLTTIVAFVIMPLMGGLFHLVFPEAKVVWQLLALSQTLLFCDYKFSLISIDSLTGINNRRSFDARMRQVGRDTDGSMPVTLFMMDINLFKGINDSYGHPEGDAALVQTACILKDIFKGTDAYLSRYGGDEFAVLYACTHAEDVRRDIYRAFTEYNNASGKPYQLTMSVGYAALSGTGKEAVQGLLKAADSALYAEKRRFHGDNR